MINGLETSDKLVGLKQSKKAIKEGNASQAFIAADAEERIKKPVIELCREFGVSYTIAESMQKLGEACRIDVPTAVAVLLKPKGKNT